MHFFNALRTALALAALTISVHPSIGHDAHAAPAEVRAHMSSAAQPADDYEAILGLLDGTFETAESTLRVEPVVVVSRFDGTAMVDGALI
jgi:hypothetical protein